MGSLAVFDRQLRLNWWDQNKVRNTSIYVVMDNPLAYLAVIALVAVGFGRINIIGSQNVYRFKILFNEYTGDYTEGVTRFIENSLGRFLKNYDLELFPITTNLASDSTVNLVKKIMDADPYPNKILLDFSTSYIIKLNLKKLMDTTRIMTYTASFGDGVKIYALSDLELGDDVHRGRQSRFSAFADVYSRALKYMNSPIPYEHLYLLTSGLILGEIALRIQDVEKNIFIPSYEIGYPFRGLSNLKPYVGAFRKVIAVGCGALGTFYAIQLALLQNMRMLSIREIVFIDPDIIELVNFNRQVLFWGNTLGMPKAEVMANRYKKMVYDKIITHAYVGKFSEFKDKIRDADLIIEGVDNWAARKEIARFAIENKIPLITAGVEVLAGHETFYIPGKTYCPFHSIDLANKKDPPERESCMRIEPSIIFTNMTISSLAILTSLALENPLNGVLYYGLSGIYEINKRFHVDKFSGSCGD